MSLIIGNVTFNSGSINYSANTSVIVGNSNFCGNAKNCGLISSGSFSNTSQNFGSINSGNFNGNSTNKGTASAASFLGSAVNSGTVTTGNFSDTTVNLTTVNNGSFAGTSCNVGIVSTASFLSSAVNNGTVSSATFTGNSSNKGTASIASFLGSAINSGTVSTGTFSETSSNLNSVSSGNFNENSTNKGTASKAIFSDSSLNSGTVSTGTFCSTSINLGSASIAVFQGDSKNNGSIINGCFLSSSLNSGTVNSGIFFDNSFNHGSTCNATFSDTSINLGCASTAMFNGNSINKGTSINACFLISALNSGTVTTGTFFDNSSNLNSVSSGRFSDTSINLGTATTATFTGTSTNKGTVSTASFLGSATNSGVVTTGSFSETSTNLTSITSGSFAGSSVNNGTVSIGSFVGSAVNSGTATTATFTGTSTNKGTVPTASFLGSSTNSGVVTTGSFSETSTNLTSITSGSFAGSSSNKGTVSIASFLGSATNSGTVTTASFTGSSTNKGSVSTASFLGSSINSGTVTTGSFSNTSINLTSITSGSFDGSSINKSTVSTASFLGSAINSGTVTTGSFLGTSINLTNVCNASFAGSSINRATLINDVTFAGSSINGGIVKNATFSETAKNTGSVTGLGSFLGSSSNSGIVQNAIFSGSGYNLGTINSSGSFYGTASNSGTVSGNAIFSGCSSNIGTVYGNASFLDGSHNNGGCIVGIATVENGDPYFLNNVILLNGDGSTKQTNATFIDESSNNFQFNNSGSGVTQGSFSPFSINGWSNYFNGSSYLTLSNSFSTGLVGVGSGQTTFETWVYPTSLQTGNSGLNVLMGNSQSAAANGRWDISLLSDVSGSGAGVYFGWSTGASISGTTGIQTVSSGIIKDAWNHVAVVVNATTPTGSSINIFVNGAKETFTGKNLSTQSGVYSQVQMGGNNNARSNFIGYMSNFKVTKNQSVYTNTFTPSTTALTTTSQGTTASNVLLLTAQDNRFIDNSLSPKTFTNTSVNTQPLNPFKATQLYNPTINGASAYFGGSNRLNFTGNSSLVFGTGNFTIDFWVNPSSTSAQGTVLKLGSTYQDVWIMIDNGAARVDFWPAGTGSPTLRLTGGAIPLNAWSHIAIVREGTGTNQTKIYINGVVSVQGTLSYNFVDSGTNYIGGLAAANFLTGYISNLRVVKGTAVYTGTFTPPTAPTTAIADTSLLLNFTNGGITDTSSKAMLRTFGDVKASSSQIKYGNGSLFLDGSGDYLTVPTSGNLFKFGTGNFTVEFWIYPLAYGLSSVGAQIFGTVNASQSGYSINLGQDINSFRIISNATGTWADNLTVSTGNGPALNQWTHMAIVRNGANLTIYKNGVSVATTSSASTWTFDGTLAVIGRYNDGTTTRDFNGYIDDLRVTKGIARYTNTFTPPESALGLTN